MKKAAILILVLISFKAVQAQEYYRGGTEFSFGINGALPVGNFDIRTKYGIGGDADLGYSFTRKYSLSVRAGYIGFIADQSLRTYSISSVSDGFVKLCGRYTFPGRFYVEPQAGFSFFKGGKGSGVSSGVQGGGGGQRGVRGNGFTYAGQIGYFVDKSKSFDVSVRYESTTNIETVTFVGLRIAYSIRPGTFW